MATCRHRLANMTIVKLGYMSRLQNALLACFQVTSTTSTTTSSCSMLGVNKSLLLEQPSQLRDRLSRQSL